MSKRKSIGHGELEKLTYLGEGTVVPEVTLVGEAVADESKLALLDVLLNGVEELLLGDLRDNSSSVKHLRGGTGTEWGLWKRKQDVVVAVKDNLVAAWQWTGKGMSVPRAWHWSIEESQQSC